MAIRTYVDTRSVFAICVWSNGDTRQAESRGNTSRRCEKEEVVESAFPVTLTDAVGNEVTLETAPATIVSLIPSNTEILFALGLAEEVIAVTDNDDYPAEVEEKEIGGYELNVEKIFPYEPGNRICS